MSNYSYFIFLINMANRFTQKRSITEYDKYIKVFFTNWEVYSLLSLLLLSLIILHFNSFILHRFPSKIIWFNIKWFSRRYILLLISLEILNDISVKDNIIKCLRYFLTIIPDEINNSEFSLISQKCSFK